MRALTVRQPWAWLLFHGKDIENREWSTGYRGPLAIHAASGMTMDEFYDALRFVRSFNSALATIIPGPRELVRGAVIGTVVQTGCMPVERLGEVLSNNPWAMGRYCHIYTKAELLDRPMPAKGKLGFWEWERPR